MQFLLVHCIFNSNLFVAWQWVTVTSQEIGPREKIVVFEMGFDLYGHIVHLHKDKPHSINNWCDHHVILFLMIIPRYYMAHDFISNQFNFFLGVFCIAIYFQS